MSVFTSGRPGLGVTQGSARDGWLLVILLCLFFIFSTVDRLILGS